MSFNLNVGLIAFTILILSFVIIFNFDSKLVPMYKKNSIAENKIEAKIFDIISNITTVKVLNPIPIL